MTPKRFIIAVMVFTIICTGTIEISIKTDTWAADKNMECIEEFEKLSTSYKKALKSIQKDAQNAKKNLGNVTKSAKKYPYDKSVVTRLTKHGVSKKKAEALARMLNKIETIRNEALETKMLLENIEEAVSVRQVRAIRYMADKCPR